jgi:4-amino-4-deoxy-L-arabinose transferase-like glycosyltransferase
MEKYFNTFSIAHLLTLSLIARIIVFYFYGDTALTNEWEKLIHNKEISGIFGFYVAESEFAAHPKLAEVGEKVLPSIYMPPLYYYFIYVIKFLSLNIFDLSNLVIIFQIFLSLVSILIFFKIVSNLTTKELSITISSIFAFYPINVLASSQISSITLQIFLLLNFFYFLTRILKKKSKSNIFFFSLFSGLLILTRGEFFLFFLLTIIYFFLFYIKNFKYFLFSIIITLIVITPYLYRNYVLFESFTLTKSFGYNLLKGNNPNFKVEGDAVYVEKEFPRNKLKIKTNNNYEINLDNFYKEKAIQNIQEDPMKYLRFYFIKVLSFLFMDLGSSYPNYYNFFHILPKIILSVTSLLGAVISLRKKGFIQYISLYYFANIFLFSIFFVLPRYSLILLPVQLLLSIDIFKYLFRKLMN